MLFPLRDNNIPVRRPIMTWALIGITSAVFVYEFSVHPQHLERIAYLFGIVPACYSHPDWAVRVGFPIDNYWPFLTSIFSSRRADPHRGQHVDVVDIRR